MCTPPSLPTLEVQVLVKGVFQFCACGGVVWCRSLPCAHVSAFMKISYPGHASSNRPIDIARIIFWTAERARQAALVSTFHPSRNPAMPDEPGVRLREGALPPPALDMRLSRTTPAALDHRSSRAARTSTALVLPS
eukprot:scaffold48392_cov31-Tisochrysis_lutea.AAC.4